VALRHIQVGDDLSAKTLYFTLDITDTTQLDNSVGKDEEISFTTAGGTFHSDGYYFSQGYNSYSLGTRYYTGIYQGDTIWDERYSEFPQIELLCISWYSGHDHADEIEGHLAQIVCPTDLGIVTYIDTSSYFYQYLYVDSDEILSSTVYLGNKQVYKVCLGDNPIPKVMLGNIECKSCSFVLDRSGAGIILEFEDGQTWKDWIDQGAHGSSAYNFNYDANGVYADGNHAVYLPTIGSNVDKDDLIINNLAYRADGYE